MNNERTSHKNNKVEQDELVQMNIYQGYVYRKDWSWLHFDDRTRFHERQQVKDQQSYILVFIIYPTFPISS